MFGKSQSKSTLQVFYLEVPQCLESKINVFQKTWEQPSICGYRNGVTAVTFGTTLFKMTKGKRHAIK